MNSVRYGDQLPETRNKSRVMPKFLQLMINTRRVHLNRPFKIREPLEYKQIKYNKLRTRTPYFRLCVLEIKSIIWKAPFQFNGMSSCGCEFKQIIYLFLKKNYFVFLSFNERTFYLCLEV